ncbi:hypothetical protein VC83_05039 [Pseudogymnoascus destructans]|uniref:CFEM domain-containing protein n=2 Tax=Pseudogymnoascus destructans TaxID=655981 RepID=L8G0H4_PSED2|nr:uncharacterized protein VC83_05039 [Pseudogymnoascus destructans]ELR06279.1 hypothetical protein GMDG_02073 [Pseudogymnoascus destructans 20631-21]OAF58515.1 hypothetical protein VC83_05039 [Pseudogymnoascus destructans]
MRASAAIALAILISVSSAAGGVPDCAKPCVDQFTSGSSIAGCNNLNTNCICSNKDFLSNIACCLVNKCDEAGRNGAIAYAKAICGTADPPVQVPDQVVCNSSSSSSSSSSKGMAAATTGGSTTGGTTQAPTTETTSTSAAQTSSSSGAAMVNLGSRGMGLAAGFAAALVLL